MRRTVASSSPTKILFATRQSSTRASRPERAQPSAYFGQCVLITQGWTKLAEIGVQPLIAAAEMPFEPGMIAVTTIGGCGFWKGFSMAPMPRSGIEVRSVLSCQRFPLRRYGGSWVQSAIMCSIDSTKSALRSVSIVSITSASEGRPPGPTPRMKRPSSSVSTIAISAAVAAGWRLARLTVPLRAWR